MSGTRKCGYAQQGTQFCMPFLNSRREHFLCSSNSKEIVTPAAVWPLTTGCACRKWRVKKLIGNIYVHWNWNVLDGWKFWEIFWGNLFILFFTFFVSFWSILLFNIINNTIFNTIMATILFVRYQNGMLLAADSGYTQAGKKKFGKNDFNQIQVSNTLIWSAKSLWKSAAGTLFLALPGDKFLIWSRQTLPKTLPNKTITIQPALPSWAPEQNRM